MNIKSILLASIITVSSSSIAQDVLVNSLKVNASAKSKELFQFTDVINLENTSVKNLTIVCSYFRIIYDLALLKAGDLVTINWAVSTTFLSTIYKTRFAKL